MPVLSPHRSTSASYRASLERPFSSYASGATFRERTTTIRTYSDSNGRSYSLRSSSVISEDGCNSRLREEPTDSALSLVDSISELRAKYSATAYVPSVFRARSAGVGDTPTKVNANTPTNAAAAAAATNRADDVDNNMRHLDAASDDDDNGNRPSVAEMTRTFEASSARHRTNNFASYIPTTRDGAPPAENGDAPMMTKAKRGGGGGGGGKEHVVSVTSSAAASPRRGAVGGASARNSIDRDGAGGVDGTSPTRQMGLTGLKNIGNTCFMNSVLQCLSNTRPLLEYVRKDGYAADINTTLSSMRGALFKAFAAVIKELWSDDPCERAVNTASLKSQIQRFAPRFMGYSQQDAQEFLRYLLEGLHEDVNRVTIKPTPMHSDIDEKLSDMEKALEAWQRYLRRENSKIVDIFVGQFKSTLKCMQCGHCSVTFDPFWDLSLPIPQKTGAIRLSQCLDSFTREETMDGDEKPTCSKCRERRKCTKSFKIHKFPKILVIHLKRFSPTERFRGKLNVSVDCPLEGLDMSDYASETNVQCRYNLYAVSNHSGTTYSGHYTAYCRHPYSGAWHEYNDSRVSSISARSVVGNEAYVLFYELDGKMAAHL